MVVFPTPWILLSIAAVFALLQNIHGYPSGAPTSTCGNMTPGHHHTPAQTSASPFVLTPKQQNVAPGSKLKVMITSTTGTTFKGFMVQAKAEGGNSNTFGKFTEIPNLVKTISCPGGYLGEPNTITHPNNTELKNLEFEWEAPDYHEGPVVFVATVVQDFSTFWVGVKSAKVTVTKRAVDNSAQSTGISTTREPVVTKEISTTSFPFVPTEPQRKASVKTDKFYDGCGSEKTCFGSTDGCVESRDCEGVVSCLVRANYYEFEMKARGSAYVALGLSYDNKMGGDSVVECVRDSSGDVKPFMSWNEAGKKYNRRLKVQDGITAVSGSFVDGVLRCKFQRDVVTKMENTTFDLAKDKYYLLLAAGSSATENNVGYHDQFYVPSENSQSLADVSILAGASKLLLRLHGAFMIAAWIGAAGIGILLARYFKQTWVGSQLCGKDQWFAWHRMFMLLTWSLTIAAFVIIFIELQDWSAEDNPHAILGCVTTALAFVQPIGAAFRPHPDSRRRPIFNWLHWLVGNMAHILAIVTIFFATKLNKAELPDWMDWILVGYVAFHVAVHLILSIASIISERNNGKRVNSFPMKEMTSSRSPLHSPERKQDSPHGCFRKFMLALYLIVIILLVAALIVITVLAPIETNWKKFQDMIAPVQNSTGQ